MTIDITDLISVDMTRFSASIAEIGEGAAKTTWINAVESAKSSPLIGSPDGCNEAREFFEGFGAWSKAELAEMSDDEINALALQYIAGDIREMEGAGSYEDYQSGAEAGRYSGRIYRQDDRFYFELSD